MTDATENTAAFAIAMVTLLATGLAISAAVLWLVGLWLPVGIGGYVGAAISVAGLTAYAGWQAWLDAQDDWD